MAAIAAEALAAPAVLWCVPIWAAHLCLPAKLIIGKILATSVLALKEKAISLVVVVVAAQISHAPSLGMISERGSINDQRCRRRGETFAKSRRMAGGGVTTFLKEQQRFTNHRTMGAMIWIPLAIFYCTYPFLNEQQRFTNRTMGAMIWIPLAVF